MYNALVWVLVASVVFVTSGCSTFRTPEIEERRLSVLRPIPPQREEIPLDISRQVLVERLSDAGSLDRVRLVEVFTSTSEATPFPRYRLFGIGNDGPFQLLGLANADILIGIEDRIIANPGVFKQFMLLLPKQNEASIEIERDGQSRLMKIKIH